MYEPDSVSYIHGKMYSISKRSTSVEEDEECCERRTKLECCLIVLVLAAGIVIAFQVFLWYNGFYGATPCNDLECIRQAAWIIESIDTRINPCGDFYRFVCGRFSSKTVKNGTVPPFQTLRMLVKHQIDAMIAEPVTSEDTSSVKAQKTLFQSCVNHTDLTFETREFLLEKLEELEFKNRTTEKMPTLKYDWIWLMRKARRMGLKYDIFLSFSIRENYMDTGVNVLEITVPLKIDNDRFVERLSKLQQILANSTWDTEDSKIAEVIGFHKIFMKVLEKYQQDSQKTVAPKKFSIQQLQQLYSYMPWLVVMNDVTGSGYNFTSDNEIIFEAHGYIEELYYVLGDIDQNTIHYYMVLRMLDDLILFIDEALRNESEGSIDGCKSVKSSRVQFCLSYAKTMMPYAVQVGYLQKYKITEDKLSEIQEMINQIENAFTGVAESIKWMNKTAKQAAIKNAKSINYYIGAPDIMLDPNEFDQILQYDMLDLNRKHFLEMVLEIRKNRHNYAVSHLGEAVSMNSYCPFCAEVTSVNAFYCPDNNIIMLPAALLQNPVFEPDAPRYLNYGLLGSIIGHEITHSFNRFVKEFENDSSTASLEKLYKEKLQCFADQYDNYFYDDVPYSYDEKSTTYETIADYTGVKLAYLAYEHWTYQNKTETELPGLQYSPEQLFWMSTVYRNCNSSMQYETVSDSYAVSSFRAMAPLRNSPYFNADFNCKSKSFMNLKNKCDYVL